MIRAKIRTAGAVLAGVLLASGMAACSSSGGSNGGSGGGTSGAPASGQGGQGEPSATLLAEGYKGTFSTPPTTGPRAAAGKTVWVISCGQVSTSCSTFANAAMEAGKAAGWTMHLYDAQLNPVNYTTGINQAIAAGAKGIVTTAVDCSLASAALTQAKNSGIKTVGFVSFDCNDPLKPTGPAVYSTFIKYHNIDTAGGVYETWSQLRAAWIIAATNGKAKLINTSEPGFLISEHVTKGMEQEMKTCTGCSIVDVQLSPATITSGKAQTQLQSALLQHQDTNAIAFLNDGFLPRFGEAAIKSVGRDLNVMGGECLDAAVNEIRTGGTEDACVAWSSEWAAWAAVDELNRQFVVPGSAPVDEGLGFQVVDKTHNLPATGGYEVSVDFQSAYKKVWTGQ